MRLFLAGLFEVGAEGVCRIGGRGYCLRTGPQRVVDRRSSQRDDAFKI
jgi:hypothetical protein